MPVSSCQCALVEYCFLLCPAVFAFLLLSRVDSVINDWGNDSVLSFCCLPIMFVSMFEPPHGIPKFVFSLQWLLQEARPTWSFTRTRLALLVGVSWYVWVKMILQHPPCAYLNETFGNNLFLLCKLMLPLHALNENLRWTWSREVWELRYIFMICERWLPCSLIDWFPTCMMTSRLRLQSRHLGLLDCST